MHRIGRTGRAGAKNIAISFAAPEPRPAARYRALHAPTDSGPCHRRSPNPVRPVLGARWPVPTTAYPAINRGTGMCRFAVPRDAKPRHTQPSRGNTAHSPQATRRDRHRNTAAGIPGSTATARYSANTPGTIIGEYRAGSVPSGAVCDRSPVAYSYVGCAASLRFRDRGVLPKPRIAPEAPLTTNQEMTSNEYFCR